MSTYINDQPYTKEAYKKHTADFKAVLQSDKIRLKVFTIGASETQGGMRPWSSMEGEFLFDGAWMWFRYKMGNGVGCLYPETIAMLKLERAGRMDEALRARKTCMAALRELFTSINLSQVFALNMDWVENEVS